MVCVWWWHGPAKQPRATKTQPKNNRNINIIFNERKKGFTVEDYERTNAAAIKTTALSYSVLLYSTFKKEYFYITSTYFKVLLS